jgi:hypothetical protein
LARIGGLDFGWTHAFAACEIYWDRDCDVVYVSRTYRVKETSVIGHCAALRPWGKDLLWAWPKDGRNETLAGAGVPLATQYRAQGLDLLHESAAFEDGGTSVEAGVMLMLNYMESGRLKVFSHLADFFQEFRLYHRRDGKIVKENDDLLCAIRYAMMSLRHARTKRDHDSFRRKIEYPHYFIA